MAGNFVMESHGKWAKNKVVEIENILKKSWNYPTAHHESHTRVSIIPYLHSCSSDLAMGGFWFAF